MRKLDRAFAFGKITPPYQGDDFDRPAFYEQDGVFFDQHDREIVPGQPLPQIVPHAPRPLTKQDEPERHPLDHDGDGRPGGSLPAGPVDPAMSPAELLASADTLPWPQFRKQAKAIFGPDCPANKDAIKIALEEAIAGYGASQQRRAERAAAQPQEPQAAPTPPPAAPVPQGKGTGIDLAAWGRGKTEYLFGDIRKEIRSRYGKVVTERHDAVDFLIEQGLITAESARKDV